MRELSERYPIWLCDLWGVVHNGVRPFPHAIDALRKHRARGGTVIFITNAPRPKDAIARQMKRVGVPEDAADDLITSGDVTRALMREHGAGGLYHLGPEKDLSIFEGVDVARPPLEQAAAVLCTGLLDERNETAETYRPVFDKMLARNLALICANPDKVVRKGEHLVPCAGALAELYGQMGGRVLMAGKPFAPIYDAAMILAGSDDRSKVLAIGDGPETDIRGAAENGFDCVFITEGINSSVDAIAATKARYPAANVLAAMPELYWP